MPFDYEFFDIKDVVLIKPRIFEDDRGFFMETYKKSDFKKIGIDYEFLQDNYSLSKKNVIRGLHFQKKPYEQGKLVSVKKGKIIDFAVDLREDSETFLKHLKVELSNENNNMLWIPPGFAHGFLSLEDNTVVTYKCTTEYAPEYDSGIIWNDPNIGIDWKVENPIISEKDKKLLTINKIYG